jgi:hypothetical protein
MTVRHAACRCGALTAECRGEPVRISVCHCLECQRRSGSAFSAQVRFPSADVTVSGDPTVYETTGDSGRWARFRFCPSCGGTIAYDIEALPGLTAIPLGAFADPEFPAPAFSVWEERKHRWVEITGDVEHD